MTDYENPTLPDNPVTTPDMPVSSGIVYTPKQFSDSLTLDLTDSEIQQLLGEFIMPIKVKYEQRFRAKFVGHIAGSVSFAVEEAMELIDQMEDEIQTRVAESMNVLIDVDASPVFEGEPPVIDVLGALPGHYSEQFGFDHEKKEWEVKKAKERGEAFLGSSKLE